MLSLPSSIKNSRIYRIIFGYDIFISYSRKDSMDYAYAIATHFMSKGFECYIDQLSSVMPGKELPPNIKNAVKNSSALVLVGSNAAAESEPIRQEVMLFLKYSKNKPLIPISIGEIINEDALWYKNIQGLPLIEENVENLKNGSPGDHIKERILNALNFTKKAKRLRQISTAILLGILIISGLACTYAKRMKNLADDAEIVKTDAEKGRDEAEKEKAIAENAKKEAEKDRAVAENAKIEAEKDKEMAEIEKGKAIEQTKKAENLKDAALKEKMIVENQKKKVELQIAKAEERIKELNAQGEALSSGIASYKWIEKDPIMAYRLASYSYKIDNTSKTSQKLINLNLSKIGLGYTDKWGFGIHKFEPPYIKLKTEKGEKREGQSIALYNLENGKLIIIPHEADDFWIMQEPDSFKILVELEKETVTPKVYEYLVIDKTGKVISEILIGKEKLNFVGANMFRLKSNNDIEHIWKVENGELRKIEGLNKLNNLRIIAKKRNNDFVALYGEPGKRELVIVNESGEIFENTRTILPQDMQEINDVTIRFSKDENFLSIWIAGDGRSGIWDISAKEFFFQGKSPSIDAYSWSETNDSLVLFYNGIIEKDKIFIQLINVNKPNGRKKIEFDLIKKAVLLPGDKRIAVHNEDYIKIYEIDEIDDSVVLKEVGSGKHEKLNKLFYYKNNLFSSDKNEFRIWSLNPNPANNWVFRSNNSIKYTKNGASDYAGRWMAVPYVRKSDSSDTTILSGIEIREIKTGSSHFMKIDKKIPISAQPKFTPDGNWLTLITKKRIHFFNLHYNKIIFDFPKIIFDFHVENDESESIWFIDFSKSNMVAYSYDSIEKRHYSYSFDLRSGSLTPQRLPIENQKIEFLKNQLGLSKMDFESSLPEKLFSSYNPNCASKISIYSMYSNIMGWNWDTEIYRNDGKISPVNCDEPWISFLKKRSNYVTIKDEDIQFVPFNLEYLEDIYNNLYWDPTEEELKNIISEF